MSPDQRGRVRIGWRDLRRATRELGEAQISYINAPNNHMARVRLIRVVRAQNRLAEKRLALEAVRQRQGELKNFFVDPSC